MSCEEVPGYQGPLVEVDRRIGREIARLRARYQLSLDEFRGLYVSDEQVDRLLGAGPEPTWRHEHEGNGTPLSGDLAGDARWEHVASEFGLSTVEQDLLLLAMAPELDLRYETLYAYLNDDVTRRWPTTDLAVRLLAGPLAGKTEIIRALAPAAALRANDLILQVEPPPARPSLLNSGFAVSPGVSRFLQGIDLAGAQSSQCEAPSSDPWSDLPLPADRVHHLRQLASLLSRGSGTGPAIVLAGVPGSGRTRTCRAISRALGRPLRTLDFSVLRRTGTVPAAAVSLFTLELRLEPAALCVRGLAALADVDGRMPQDVRGLLADLGRVRAPLFVVTEPGLAWRDLLGPQRALLVHFGVPDYAERLRLWGRSLDAVGIVVPKDERHTLADRFAFTPREIDDTVATARDWLEMSEGGRATAAVLLGEAARAQPRDRVASLATLVPCRHGWDDLVLPGSTVSRLRELAAAIRLRHVVYGEWAFARRIASGTGVKAMFAGASGTGKTMAAGVIARDVGLDLVKVDLSGIVSKYIGETEKNLDRVFAGARAGNALLFFDEADAIFGKRSEVKDAHDRYANIEVAYLLQKLEEHDGVVILATNLRRNVDEAFSRRLHYVVDFPQPDAPLRARLWRGMFPAEAPIAGDLDFGFLSRQFELVGGDIRNVVLDAAFLAADEREAIGMRHIVRALARQMSKQGKSPSPAEFQRYFELAGS